MKAPSSAVEGTTRFADTQFPDYIGSIIHNDSVPVDAQILYNEESGDMSPRIQMTPASVNQPLFNFLQYLKQKPIARLVHVRLGVWDVIVRKQEKSWAPALPSKDKLMEYVSHASLVWRFVKEIHGIAPRQFWIHVLNGIWTSFEGLLSVYASDLVYTAIMDHLQQPGADVKQIRVAIACQLAVIVATQVIEKLVQRNEEILSDRIAFHFLIKFMTADLHRENDMIDSQRATSGSSYYGRSYFRSKALAAFQGLTTLATSAIRTTSQLLFTYHVLRRYPIDPALIMINAIEPFFLFSRDYLYNSDIFVYSANEAFKRMVALYRMVSDDGYSTDIKSDGLQNYITEEFKCGRENIGDANVEDYIEQWESNRSILATVFDKIVGKIPTTYFALRLIFRPKSLTPSSYAHMQNAARAVYSSVYSIALERQATIQDFLVIRDIYQEEVEEIARRERESRLIQYPRNEDKSQHLGMEIEFRDVTFRYPGSSINALNNVSFVIKPGQLVAIVGVNGSGKSSITNLFNRLYDATEGQILVDGLPLESYRRADVRRSMAILRQSHILYPLSLRENIALGMPDRPCSDRDLEIALKCGGASNFIQKLTDGLDTALAPVSTVSCNMTIDGNDPELAHLKAIEDSEIQKDVSGGEGQRLAASRTFLRLRGGGIRFLAADEPTSALDPEGEFELFTRLKQQRGDMTVVFITHRFGHITKYADLILCMKDGWLIEQGTHDELVAKGGEYYKLHSVQARAFTEELYKEVQIGEPGKKEED